MEAVRPDDVYYFNNYYYTIYDVNIYIYGRLQNRIIRTYKYEQYESHDSDAVATMIQRAFLPSCGHCTPESSRRRQSTRVSGQKGLRKPTIIIFVLLFIIIVCVVHGQGIRRVRYVGTYYTLSYNTEKAYTDRRGKTSSHSHVIEQ